MSALLQTQAAYIHLHIPALSLSRAYVMKLSELQIACLQIQDKSFAFLQGHLRQICLQDQHIFHKALH